MSDFSPSLFPLEHTFFVAPYWADSDIRDDGEVSYRVRTSQASAQMSLVSEFISERQNILFEGEWMLLVEWNEIPEFSGSDDEVPLKIPPVIFFKKSHN